MQVIVIAVVIMHMLLHFSFLNCSASMLKALLIFQLPVKDSCTRRGLNFVSLLIMVTSQSNAEVLLIQLTVCFCSTIWSTDCRGILHFRDVPIKSLLIRYRPI